MDETGTNGTGVTTAAATPVVDPMLAGALPPELAEAVFVPEVVSEVMPEVDPTPLPDSLFSNSRELENGKLENSSNPAQVPEEQRIVERVVEKIVEVEKEVIKEVIKEVPVEVEKIVEKIVEVEKPVEKIVEVEKVVYRDAEPKVCPPPTDEEIDAIHKDFMIRLSKEGTAKKHELMIEKMDRILTFFNTKPKIVREDVMDLLECSGTTATRLLTELRHDGKLALHGTSPHTFTYTKP